MKRLCIVLLIVFMQGCATLPPDKDKIANPLTAGNVSLQLKKGITTKAEVLKVFGAPNIVTQNRNEDEVWSYNRMSYTTQEGTDSGTLIFWGGSRAVSTATTRSFDLFITFGKNDVVKDYSLIQASY